jgi:hypothetical protein
MARAHGPLPRSWRRGSEAGAEVEIGIDSEMTKETETENRAGWSAGRGETREGRGTSIEIARDAGTERRERDSARRSDHGRDKDTERRRDRDRDRDDHRDRNRSEDRDRDDDRKKRKEERRQREREEADRLVEGTSVAKGKSKEGEQRLHTEDGGGAWYESSGVRASRRGVDDAAVSIPIYPVSHLFGSLCEGGD